MVRTYFDNPPPSQVAPWITASSCEIEVTESELQDSLDNGITARSSMVAISNSTIRSSAKNGIDVTGSLGIKNSTIVDNHGIGVSIAGSLELSRTTVARNLQGGVSLSPGSFQIVNNFIYRNGNDGGLGVATSPFGGLRLEPSAATSNQVVHNTIFLNTADVSATPVLAGGIYCTLGDASNNIIVQNFRGNAELPNAQTGGGCTFGNSRIGSDAAAVGFVDYVADNLHLAAASDAINSGNSTVPEDFDGDPRNDGLPDLGADEFAP